MNEIEGHGVSRFLQALDCGNALPLRGGAIASEGGGAAPHSMMLSRSRKPLSVRDCVARTIATVVAGFLVGCQSPSQYTSPRIEGCVLDAETGEPLREVQVRRAEDVPDPRPLDPPKGATALKSVLSARSRVDGTFVLASQRELDFLPRARWYSITLSFEHPGYLRRTAIYTLAQSTNTPSGEPLVEAGEVLMDRIPK
jgi:hypothetical protein